MADSAHLRPSFPSLKPPGRPKKASSPRLLQRRASTGRRRPMQYMMRGRENNENDNNGNNGVSSNAKAYNSSRNQTFSSSDQSPISSTDNPLSTAMTAVDTSSDLQPQNCQQILQPQKLEIAQHGTDEIGIPPLSPTATSPGHVSSTTSKLTLADDEDSIQLTPRNLVMDASTDIQITLTPPASSPVPLIVSAKRLGSKIKKNYATKRRRPQSDVDDDDSTNNTQDDKDTSMVLPEGLSPGQRAQEYWNICYGNLKEQELLKQKSAWCAKKAAPAKSCLSHSKPKTNAQILLPPESALLQSPTLQAPSSDSPIFSTPKSSPADLALLPQHKCSHSKSVQFGTTSAAEYELDAPSRKFTPLPAEIASKRFPLTEKKENDDKEEEIAETKENSAMLAEWDSVFDDDEENESPRRRKRHSSKKHRSQKKHRKSFRSERRQSSTFCSPSNSVALYDPTQDANDTPEKQNAVMDDLASLSMTSPAPQHQLSEDHTGNQNSGTEFLSFSPVVARRLSSEPALQSITQDDEKPVVSRLEKIKPELFMGTVNIWDEAKADVSILSTNEKFDPFTVFTNLACSHFEMNCSTHTTADPCPALEDALTPWHTCLGTLFQVSLDSHLDQNDLIRHTELDEDIKVDSLLEEKWKRAAHYEWKKLELELMKSLKSEILKSQKQVQLKSNCLDAIEIPALASLEPTRQHLIETMQAIERLEALILEENQQQTQMQERHNAAHVQCCLRHAPLATLSYHAIRYLSPVDIAISHQHNEAIFNHLLDGVETRMELNGSWKVTVPNNSATIDATRTFCNSMLCGSLIIGSNTLQEGLDNLSQTDDVNERLLMLAVLFGRIDLAAQSLAQVTAAHELTVDTSWEDGHPVVVASLKLTQSTTLRVFYRRDDPRGVFWSLPTTIIAEQNGKSILDLQITDSSRSLEATANFLPSVCDHVLQKLEENREGKSGQ